MIYISNITSDTKLIDVYIYSFISFNTENERNAFKSDSNPRVITSFHFFEIITPIDQGTGSGRPFPSTPNVLRCTVVKVHVPHKIKWVPTNRKR